MNIESTTATATKTAENSTAAATTTNTATSKDESKSFKGQLEAAKSQDASATKTSEDLKTVAIAVTTEDAKTVETTNAQKTATTQLSETKETAKNNFVQQATKDKSTKDTAKNKETTDPIAELSSKIATLSELKSGISKTQGLDTKTKETTNKNDLCTTIKMDNKDVSFFLNLVQNQQMAAQAGQASTSSQANTTFTDIKSEVTQKTVQVSSTLLDAMNESSKTGKSFRIDFDSDVAVIMKVDRNGTLSANFIPGDAAVENYLRNNIAGLRQNFENQGLAYNELSYSKQQNRDQQGQQGKQKNNKENENE